MPGLPSSSMEYHERLSSYIARVAVEFWVKRVGTRDIELGAQGQAHRARGTGPTVQGQQYRARGTGLGVQG